MGLSDSVNNSVRVASNYYTREHVVNPPLESWYRNLIEQL